MERRYTSRRVKKAESEQAIKAAVVKYMNMITKSFVTCTGDIAKNVSLTLLFVFVSLNYILKYSKVTCEHKYIQTEMNVSRQEPALGSDYKIWQ